MSKRQGFARMLVALVASFVTLGLSLALVGCGKKVNEEEIIRQAVTETMDIFKNPTEEALAEVLKDADSSLEVLDEYGIDIYEFMGHCFRNFDYSIGEISIDGDVATAELTVTNTDLQSAIETASDDITNNYDEYLGVVLGDDGERQFMQLFFQKVYEQMDATDETVTNDVTLKLKKEDGVWDVDDSGVDAVVSAMFGGLEM